jgi:hypothetical protein
MSDPATEAELRQVYTVGRLDLTAGIRLNARLRLENRMQPFKHKDFFDGLAANSYRASFRSVGDAVAELFDHLSLEEVDFVGYLLWLHKTGRNLSGCVFDLELGLDHWADALSVAGSSKK